MIARTLVSLAALATAQAATAQSTSIVPDVAPGLSLGTTVSHSGNVYTVDGGTTAGTNLFHSFNNFDLGAGDTAQWVYSGGNPANLTSVISRVTGGSPSSILGVIVSTAIPNADFYFINPAGIVFSGQDAQVNVPAAAHFSTASELRFADGAVFSVATPGGSTLSVASPAAFGFLGNEGDILLSSIEALEDPPFITQAGAVSFSAANIGLDNVYIGASEQSFTAVGSAPLTVGIDGTTDGPAQGRVEMVNSWLQTWAADCLELCLGAEGFISIDAGELDLNLTGIVADFDSISDEGGSSFLRLTGNNWVNILDSIILADGYGTAAAGDISINSFGDVNLVGSLVQAYTQGSGDAGTIEVSGANVLLSGTTIGSESYGSGHSGSVVISAANSLALESGAWVFTTGFDSGAAGSVSLTATDIAMTDSLVGSESYGSGDAGGVAVTSGDTITLVNSTVSSSTFGEGTGGSVDISAGGMLLVDASSITSNSSATGHAGDISVAAGEALLANGSVISSDGLIDGDAGNISVTVAGQLQMGGGSRISSSGGEGFGEDPAELPEAEVGIFSAPPVPPPPGQGNPDPILNTNRASAGTVNISAGSLVMSDFSEIATRSYGSGDAGSITVAANEIDLNGALILSDSMMTGDAGDVLVTASNASVIGAHITSDAEFDGNAGDVIVSVSGHLDMYLSKIGSDAGAGNYVGASGDAGSVTVTAGLMTMSYSEISAAAWSSGEAGEVTVEADSLSMDWSRILTHSIGEGDAGTVNIDVSGALSLSNSIVGSNAIGGGDAGDVTIAASSAVVSDGSSIQTGTSSTGEGGAVTLTVDGELQLIDSTIDAGTGGLATGDSGNVTILASTLTLGGASAISTTSFGFGDAGQVSIVADVVSMRDDSQISSDANGTGNAGGVVMEAATISMSDASTISSDAISPDGGQGGNVKIVTGDLNMESGSSISTTSANSNAAGHIEITAEELSIAGDQAQISSENVGDSGGAAGSVLIHSNAVSITDGARVSTNSLTGAAGDITFDMAPGSLLILAGETAPGVIETSSGPGTGGIITIASPLAIISNGGTISALGESGGANVQIDANYFIASSDRPNVVQVDGTLTFSNAIYDVSSGTTTADLSMVDASGVLQGQCSTVRATGQLSQLNIRPSGPFGSVSLPAIRAVGTGGPSGAASGACQ